MKELIFVVISICLNTGGCQTHQMKVESRVCQMKTVRAQVPINGVWQDATVKFKC